MMMNSKDEIAFAKQLNDFEASMQSDLQSRTSELSKRWEFDFESEAPTLSKKMSWEPVESAPVKPTRPRLQIVKPKMSIGNLTDKDNSLTQAFSAGLANRSSLFGPSEHSESTAADSMFSGGSIVGSLGKNSFVDFSMSMGRRTSIAQNLQLRRRTEVAQESALRSDESSLNERSSTIEEGNVNVIQPSISAGKCHSDVKYEETKEPLISQRISEGSAEHLCDSHRSGNSGRAHNAIRSFVNVNDETDGLDGMFAPAKEVVEHNNNSSGAMNKEVEGEEDCDAGDTDEHKPLHVPFENAHAAIQNRNPETFGQSNK